MEPREYQNMYLLEDSYWWYVGLHHFVLKNLSRTLNNYQKVKVLDAGCGTGGNMTILSQSSVGPYLYGVDLHPLAIEHAQKRGIGKLARGSVEILPFSNRVFDLVISLDVLYIKGIEDQKAIKEFHRVLKPGGTVFLNLPAFEFLRGRHDLAVHTQRRYTKREVAALLLSAGFRIEKITYWNTLLFPLLFIWRPMSRLWATGRAAQSDLQELPPLLNKAITFLILKEVKLACLLSLPFGSSVFAVGRKDGAPGKGCEFPALQ